MVPRTVRVRARWLDGRVFTLEPMEPGAETTEIRGLGQDDQWYSFRYAGEIDTEGFLIFVQHPQPITVPLLPPAASRDFEYVANPIAQDQ
jgi:hypothetical protein